MIRLSHFSKIHISIAVAIVLAGIALLLSTVKPAQAADSNSPAVKERIVTVHDNGVSKGVITEKSSLREILKDVNVKLDSFDRTEPAIDTQLKAGSYDVNIYRARPVVIKDGASSIKVMSSYRTGKQIASQAGIVLNDKDVTTLKPSADVIEDGAAEVMTITRATPFTLILYGKNEQLYTFSKTVKDVLKEKGVTLGADDTAEPAIAAPITANMTIKIWRNGKQQLTQDEVMPFTTEHIKDSEKEVGYKEVKTPGKKGKRTVIYEIIMQNGVEVSRKEISSNTIEQPVGEVVVVGAKMSNTFSGSFAEALARLRSCEGSYTSNTGNGYYGAYQYDLQTWGNYMGYPNAAAAPPAVQDQKAWETYQRRGWQPWPSCRIKMGLQDIYR